MDVEPHVAPADRVGLGMEVRPVDGERHLILPPRRVFGWLDLAELELRIPAVAHQTALLPDDATAFQRVRSSVVSARLAMSQADLGTYVSGFGAALARLGVDELELRCCDSYIGLSARVRESALVADLSARIYLSPEGSQLRVACGQPRVYGHLDTPAPILAHKLIAAILRIGESRNASELGLCDFLMHPLRSSLFHSLPAAGWRLPDLGAAPLVSALVTPEGIVLEFSEDGRTIAPSSQAAVTLNDNLKRYRSTETRLAEGLLEDAMRGYRGELAARGPEHPFLVERILSIASARRDYFADGLELARQVLGRWPDFAPAHAAIASIAVAQGDVESGAARYRDLCQASGAVGDEEGTVRAALAGARLLRQFAADDSTLLYEIVLEHRPGHAEAAEALADRYRDEERWPDLVRLIRMRLAATRDPKRQARDHARLAEVLFAEQEDPAAALAELTAACRLDNSMSSVHEQRADVEFVLGRVDDALASLEWAGSLHRMRNDERAQLRTLMRGADGALAAERFDTAEAWYLAALDLVHSHGPAMRGAARAAAGLGNHDDAARMWRELFDAGIESPPIQAYYACELGRSLASTDASGEALPPLLRASETGGARTRAEALHLIAALHKKQGAHAEALSSAQRALEAYESTTPDEGYPSEDIPVDRRSRAAVLALWRAELAEEMGRGDEAEANLRESFNRAMPGEESRKQAARILLKNYSQNSVDLRWIEELYQGNPDADECAYLDVRKAALLRAEGDPQAALLVLEAPLGRDDVSDAPKSAALEEKAAILEELGDASARADVLEARARLSGSNLARAEAFVESGEGWLSADDPKRCRSALNLALQALEGAEDDERAQGIRARALTTLANCAWRSRDWAAVAESYSELYETTAAKMPPEDRLRWGVALESLGKTEESIAALERITRLPGAPAVIATQACRHLATLYERLGMLAEAAAAQEHYASSEAAGLSEAAQADAWYQAGAIHRRSADGLQDAKRCLDNALRIASDHLPALDALEQIARDEQTHERLAVILGRKIAVMAAHPSRQRGLLVRLAELQEHKLGRIDVARETYRRVLTISPTYRPALEFAAQDAKASGNARFAAESFELLAGTLEHDSELSLSLDELTTQREQALFALAAVVVESGGQVATESATALLLKEAKERGAFPLWAALAAAYRRQADLGGLADALGRMISQAEPGQALELSLERIALLADEIGDHDKALIALRIAEEFAPQSQELARWHALLSGDEDTTPSTAALEASEAGEALPAHEVLAKASELVASGEWEDALRILAPFSAASAGSELLWLHVEAALGAGKPKKAIALLPRIAEVAKDDGDTVEEHRATRRLADLVLEAEGAEDVALQLYERALALDPGDLIAAELCTELRRVTSQKTEEFAETEPQTRRPGAAAEARQLQARARDAIDAGDLSAAGELLEAAIKLAPSLAELHHERADVALAANEPGVAAQWLARLADALATDEATGASYRGSESDLHLQLADLYYDKLSEPAKAREHMRKAALTSTSEMRKAATLRQLASEAASAGCHEVALEALESIGLESLSSHERQTAAVLYRKVGRDHAAIELLESARLAGTLTSEGRSLLFSLHRGRSRNKELAESLERGARSAPNSIAATRLREALRIYEHVLADGEGAARIRERLSALSDVADTSPEAPISALEQAAEDAAANGDGDVAAGLLCRAIQSHCQRLGSEGQPPDASTRGLLSKLREHVLSHRQTQMPTAVGHAGPTAREVHALVRALGAVAAIEDKRDATATLLREVALLRRNELNDIRGAADAMAQALSLRADDPDILVELADMLTEAGDHAQLASAYELHLGTIEGPRRAYPLIELGKLCHHVFGERERALRCYDEAAEVDSSVAEEVRALKQALGVAHGLGNLADQELSAELDKALALESQGRHAEALDIYEAAAANAPQDPRPFLALRRIYEDRGESERLARVLEQLTTLSSSRRERASLFYDRAILARDEYHDDMLVYEYLKEAAANDPEDPRYSHALRTIAMARGEWALAAELTYREISSCTDTEELGALYLELALIFDEKLLDAPQALANYEQALTLDPTIPAAPRPLARLYELDARYEDAAAMYQKAAKVSPDPNERGRLLRHAAMCAEQADNLELAKSLYTRVTEIAGRDDREAAEDAIARISGDETPTQTTGLLTVDEMRARLVGLGGDPSERAKLLFQLGQAYQHELGDSNAALRAYEESLRLDSGLMASIDALADLCYQQRDWPRAHHFYGMIQPELSALPPAMVALRQAEIAEAMGNEAEAFEAFRWALEFAPHDTQVLAGLCRSASRVGEHAEALLAQQTLVRLIPVEDTEQLQSARVYLADLYLSLGDHEGAIRSYEELLADIPDSLVAKRELPGLYLEVQQPRRAIAAQKSLIQVTPSHKERAELLFELGEMQAEISEDPNIAAEAYFRAIDLDPDHVPTLRRLLAYYCDEGDFQATSEMAADLLRQNALLGAHTSIAILYRAGIAAALAGDLRLARTIGASLGNGAPDEVARAVRKLFDLSAGPDVEALAEATRTLCDAAGEDLESVSDALSTQQSERGLLDLVKALSELAV